MAADWPPTVADTCEVATWSEFCGYEGNGCPGSTRSRLRRVHEALVGIIERQHGEHVIFDLPRDQKILLYVLIAVLAHPLAKLSSGSGFDTFLIEGYQYPGINHNLDQATRCAQYPWKELAWDQLHSRYLMGLYYATWPWLREQVKVDRLALPAIKLWAYDHLCLFGWPVPLPTSDDRSFIY